MRINKISSDFVYKGGHGHSVDMVIRWAWSLGGHGDLEVRIGT